MGEEIPIIDMQENNVNKLREACEKWGCFRVVNHGVPTTLMAEIKSVAVELFDRPVDIKQKNKEELPGSGYVGVTQTNPVYEALAVDIFSSLSIPTFCSDLHASPHQREIIERYVQNLHKLGIDIASRMVGSSRLDDDIVKVCPSHFRMNKYTITQENIGTGGLPMHTDGSLFTILLDDEHLGGLEIVDPSGKLLDVDRFPGSFLINLGDIAVPWSNGKMRNLKHRVICKDVGIRMSIAIIITPPTDEDMKAHQKFIEGDSPPEYVPFNYAEFRKLRAAKKMYAGEALELLRWKN
ncbi:2-oxoglutarate-dependent dioxygenase DAO-like [Silene latifolia]|uniref:2-oxoglutarate-dependent dioxygenase DAO-like n=1 Tax=Silene latifolia TaxID=37657 RepID=UPI003D7801AA